MTLIALLKAAAYGWRQEAVSRSAEEVSELGRMLHDRIVDFAEHLGNSGKALSNAVKHLNSAIGSFEQRLVPGALACKFIELGAKGTKELRARSGSTSRFAMLDQKVTAAGVREGRLRG